MQQQEKKESIFSVVSYISIFTLLNSLRKACSTARVFCRVKKDRYSYTEYMKNLKLRFERHEIKFAEFTRDRRLKSYLTG
jgi:hypothetical protein